MKNITYIIFALLTVFISCKEDESTEQMPGELKLNFQLLVDESSLVFGDTYTNASGNEYSVRSFWVYLSNIKLVGNEGTSDFQLEDSYHLIEDGSEIQNPRLSINLSELPAGSYQSIEMAIGVNEPVNTDISAVSGDLDPARAWNWDSGYKFISVEGSYFPPGADSRGLIMHIGLNQNYKELSFDVTENLTIDGNTNELDFSIDINKMFEGAHLIDFSETNSIKANPVESGKVAENYANAMIQLK